MNNPDIVIFDGICNFCNGAVNFIIKRDPNAKFTFTPMQSPLAKDLMKQHKINNVGMDTFVLIKDGQALVFSSAALEISKGLTGYWYLFNIFKLVPSPIRDGIYKLFARNRYKLFGKANACMVPSVDFKSRFIGV